MGNVYKNWPYTRQWSKFQWISKIGIIQTTFSNYHTVNLDVYYNMITKNISHGESVEWKMCTTEKIFEAIKPSGFQIWVKTINKEIQRAPWTPRLKKHEENFTKAHHRDKRKILKSSQRERPHREDSRLTQGWQQILVGNNLSTKPGSSICEELKEKYLSSWVQHPLKFF